MPIEGRTSSRFDGDTRHDAGDRAGAAEEKQPHGGLLAARRLKARGVTKLFTLSGGHLFSLYDGCRTEGIDLIDTRHESAAAFAAEGWAKVTREPGVCALTAGPGVTNGMSAIASAHKNNSPMLVLGGRAPQMRWGQGSLQEIDHVPFVRAADPQRADGVRDRRDPGADRRGAGDGAARAHRSRRSSTCRSTSCSWRRTSRRSCPTLPDPRRPARRRDGDAIEQVGALLAGAERPVIMAGTDLYWGHGEAALRELSEALGIPVFLNGLARGCLPADHPNFFSRARSAALKGADVALVIGVPMDFRLGFGGSFGEDTKIVQIEAAEPERDAPRELAGELYGGLPATLVGAARGRARGGRLTRSQTAALARVAARDRGREARRRGGGPERRPRAAASAARVQGAAATCSTATRS